ncbi:MAG: acyl-phosphate glycerol 3-phosphate acyltransferase [Candidatus Rokubacteria bacterium 13_1_20CM_2_70_7]|nr:MAG: acyl-phosphate glycerol 3-phosphate acyltransferase [Candidatus Rokubacteria bacterium 13_1_20CM_2_70_7]
MTTLAAVVAAYLIGAVPVGFLIARAFGIGDIRRQGSGNIGATNVLRTAGRLPALLTLVGDIAKGYVAVAAGGVLGGGAPEITAAATVAAIVGNCWSVFLLFRGGKGVATGLGAFLKLVPLAALPAAVTWLAVTLTFRYVSLGSLLAALCVPLGALLFGYPPATVAACVVATAVVVLRHHENIARLLAGTERRLGERRA